MLCIPDQKLQCSVCFDDFALSEEVRRLNCDHHFHQPCIVPWLELHSTCPVCRKPQNDAAAVDADGDGDAAADSGGGGEAGGAAGGAERGGQQPPSLLQSIFNSVLG